jgi:cation diffusion facilitator CzcD-associated flavoprotein CzcO
VTPARDGARTEPAAVRHVRVAVIGAGFGGIGTGIRLRQAGVTDFVILERAGSPGGTWFANTYPGAQCDIPSILYSFSFAPNPHWTRLYPRQAEILDYLRNCVARFGLTEHVRLGHELQSATWDGIDHLWRLQTSHGPWTADVLVAATGPFSEPSIPDLPGLESFAGTTFHSAAWDHGSDLRGRRVAVVGTGASAVQFVPHLQSRAAHLTVFQRTPTWILPHPNRPVGPHVRRLFRHVPGAQRLSRSLLNLAHESLVPGLVHQPALLRPLTGLARRHLRRQVADPALRRALTPGYAFGCKRPTFSNDFYPALSAPNVSVVTSPIERVTPRGIRTADGVDHPLDAIVFGTGFKLAANAGFRRIVGRHGRSLAETWSDGDMTAYLGTTVAGFPNFFMVLGPNSVVYTSQVVTIEAQVDYILAALRTMQARGLRSLEVTASAQRDFVDHVDRRLAGSVWNTGGCRSYYLSPSGRNFTFWPGSVAAFRRRMRALDLTHYDVVPRSRATAAVPR